MRVSAQDTQLVSLLFRYHISFLREARRGTKPAEADYLGRGRGRGRGGGKPCRVH